MTCVSFPHAVLRVAHIAFALLAALSLAAPAIAAQARTSLLMDPAPSTPSHDAAIAVRHELAALALVEADAQGGQGIHVRLSDGHGVDWSAAVRVDGDPGGAPKSLGQGAVAVFGDVVHVAWLDQRNGRGQVYLVRSDDRGATWSGETAVPTGVAGGQASVQDWAFVVSPVPGGGPSHVYVLMSVRGAGQGDAAMLAVSSDGGRSFAQPLHAASGYAPGAHDVDRVALAAPREDVVVYALWQDDRSGAQDLYFRTSEDNGAHWARPERRMNAVAGVVEGPISLSAQGFRLQAAWGETAPPGGTRKLVVDWSADRGRSWQPQPDSVGGYAAGVDHVSDLRCLRNRQLLTVTWTDDRSGRDECYVATRKPNATQWDEYLLSTGGAREPRIIGHRDYMAVVWRDASPSASTWASISRDRGITWDDPAFRATTTAGVEHWTRLAHSKRYGNFLLAHSADDAGVDGVYAGGFRGAHARPAAPLRAGGAASFVVEDFPSSEEGWGFRVLVSGGTGAALLPAGDGRALGLAADGILARTLNRNAPAALGGTLDADGNGATPSAMLPPVLGAGTSLSLCAVSLDPAGGFGHLTDVVTTTVLP